MSVLALHLRGFKVTAQCLAGAVEAADLLDEIEDINRHDRGLLRSAAGEAHRAVLEPDGIDHFGEVCPCVTHLHGGRNQFHAYMVTEYPESLLVQDAFMYSSFMSNATAKTSAALSPREKMTALVNAQPLNRLATALLMLDAKTKLDEAERLTRAVIIDSICERCPAAEAAFDAWAESDDTDPHTAARAMAAAAMAA